MSFVLPREAIVWRSRVRAFVDRELQPFEVEAEMNAGRISPDERKRHEKFAIDAGITRMDTPSHWEALPFPCSPRLPSSSSLAG